MVATAAGERARAIAARLRTGLELLVTDTVAAEAFAFANHTMWQQRLHTFVGLERRKDPRLTLPDAETLVISYVDIFSSLDFRDDAIHTRKGFYIGNQLQIAGGVPLLNLRFLVEATEYSGENRQAVESAAMMRDAVERVALTGALSVLRRSRGKWLPV